ncbi:right-handed parallel beta-helix repeat-containing protein [Ginsengibacter hankyongi]|uniref:Right-handed parallel beta-helix repeat-containing protein n=1 Tax=Ginsengibacter hankyongi TaxID=2607284 RepID=A0A5J5ILA9_9BACT|nr:right-handed parallel beta-helix repeat-containing protein [Ginsengibacter hankyongi]KAA9041905.1 right-handed parallel beta-helix repeat-containing protein [Ginsengibacter hankyongi]
MKSLIYLAISFLTLLEYSFAAPNNSMTIQTSDTLCKTYFVHPQIGDDHNPGTSKERPFRTLQQIEKIHLGPGDKIMLADGQVYQGNLNLVNQEGNKEHYIEVKSTSWDGVEDAPAVIDFKNLQNGILLKDCSFIKVSNIHLTGEGYTNGQQDFDQRCAVLILSDKKKRMQSLLLEHLTINDVYFENKGFKRGREEVKSANGTQKYGWGIKLFNNNPENLMENITIQNCSITDVSHTGIKLIGSGRNIKRVNILNNKVLKTGGPGIQMSGVQFVYVANNDVQYSGSNDDSRKWGRGSGLWTWGSSDVLIEKNKFLHANGPGDSDGAHIDFNCDNIVIQYNLSGYNAGGFCEILGNNYNCTYRYNISINDGSREKGVNGAFQDGKTLWLSGFQGSKNERKGPIDTYIYNNTIYADESIHPKMAFDNTSNGVLIANNIFYLANPSQLVLGDQYKPDTKSNKEMENVLFENNLFLKAASWPLEMKIRDSRPIYGDVNFKNPRGLNVVDYTPLKTDLIKNKGIQIPYIKGDYFGLLHQLKMEKDILGNPVPSRPSLGAIEPLPNN